VYPLSLVEINEDYVFESTPEEVERLIQTKSSSLEELINGLEPTEGRQLIYPLVQIASDVARTTAEIATLNQSNLILVGWHRPAFSQNRLGGRVGQILTTAAVDVAVFVERDLDSLETLLVPYTANIHDELGVELALRLLINSDRRSLTILQVACIGQPPNELSNEFRALMSQLSSPVRNRIDLQIVEAAEPIQAVIQASEKVDLTIAGTSRAWGIEGQTLGRYTDILATECRSSLLITRRYSHFASHLSSLFTKNRS